MASKDVKYEIRCTDDRFSYGLIQLLGSLVPIEMTILTIQINNEACPEYVWGAK